MKILSIIILLINTIISIHANGRFDMQSEAEKRYELEQYPITVSPISLQGLTSYDYVFIDDNTIILTGGSPFIKIDLLTNTQSFINFQIERESVDSGFRNFKYDKKNNLVHMVLKYRENIGFSYYVLHLDDYSLERIDELGNEIINGDYHYDEENMLVYIHHFMPYEDRMNRRRYISTFDFEKCEIIDTFELYDTYYVDIMYSSPLKILASTRSNQINGELHFFIYDLSTRTRVDFPESTSIIKSTSIISNRLIALNNNISLNEDLRFIGIESGQGFKSSIGIMDLYTNTVKTVALENFPFEMYSFKEISQGKYSFMVRTRTPTGAHGQSFLCFLDYP
jgi:hypothetical protein